MPQKFWFHDFFLNLGTQSSSESSSEGSGSSSESDVKDKAERKQSNTSSSTRKNEVINELIAQFKSLERPDWHNVSFPSKSPLLMVIGKWIHNSFLVFLNKTKKNQITILQKYHALMHYYTVHNYQQMQIAIEPTPISFVQI